MIRKSAIAATLVSCAAFSTAATAISLNGLLTINAGSYDTDTLTYTGGAYFSMSGTHAIGDSYDTATAVISPGSDGGILLGSYQNFVLNPDEPHPAGWQGDINGDGVPDGAAGGGYGAVPVSEGGLASPFSFFKTNTYIGTNPVSYQSGDNHLAPTAELDMASCVANICNFSIDLSSWEVMWNGSAFEQGPRPSNTGNFELAMGTYDLDTKQYTLIWQSQIKGGAFDGVVGTWYLEGTHVVPVPAAVWLFGSGLLGLVGVARRKKS